MKRNISIIKNVKGNQIVVVNDIPFKGESQGQMYNEASHHKKTDLDKIIKSQEPPGEEPARQYYFMAKCQEHVKAFAQKNGRPPKACVTTFGCQMNARDSEKLLGILEAVGFSPTDSEQADFVIYNTCTVRDNANQRVYGRLGELNRYKRLNPQMKIALCGCMMQEPAVIEKLKKSYPFIDLIFGTHNIYKFAELLWASFESKGMLIDIWEDTDKIVEDLPVDRKYPFKSGINIMFGCNNFCSYCIVPYVRGRERSRAPKEILREIEKVVADGVVEVMLLGQNVNSYGKNLDEPVTFAELLREVEKYPPEEVYCIGGESVYEELLPYCDTAHITKIDQAYEADAHFPNLDRNPEWEVTADSDELTYFDIAYTFLKYERKK